MEENNLIPTIPRCEITPGRLLGQGGFGSVLQGDKKGKMVALKILHAPVRVEKYVEFNYLVKLKHRNLVTLIGIVDTGLNACPELVFQFIPGGNLLDFVKKNTCSKKTLIKIGFDIINGMEYLHNMNCLHRALAARNVLMDGNCNAKITDFGLGEILDGQGSNYYRIDDETVLPIRWVPKECIPSNSNPEPVYGREADVWAYGVVIWEAASKGDVPYGAACSNSQVRQMIQNGSNPLKEKRPESCPEVILKLMESIFEEDPMKRPTFMDLRKRFQEMQDKETKQTAEASNSSTDNPTPGSDSAPSTSGNKKKGGKAKAKAHSNQTPDSSFKTGDKEAEGDSEPFPSTKRTDQLPRSDPIPKRNAFQGTQNRDPNPRGPRPEFQFQQQRQREFRGHAPGHRPRAMTNRYSSGTSTNFEPRQRPQFRRFDGPRPGPALETVKEVGSQYKEQKVDTPAPASGPPPMVTPFNNPEGMNPNYPFGQMPMMYPQAPMQIPMQMSMQMPLAAMAIPGYPHPYQFPAAQQVAPLQVTVNQTGGGGVSEKNLEEQVKLLQEKMKEMELEKEEAKQKEAEYSNAGAGNRTQTPYGNTRAQHQSYTKGGPGRGSHGHAHPQQQHQRQPPSGGVWVPGGGGGYKQPQVAKQEKVWNPYQGHNQDAGGKN